MSGNPSVNRRSVTVKYKCQTVEQLLVVPSYNNGYIWRSDPKIKLLKITLLEFLQPGLKCDYKNTF